MSLWSGAGCRVVCEERIDVVEVDDAEQLRLRVFESLRCIAFDLARPAVVSAMGVSQHISGTALRAMMSQLTPVFARARVVCSLIGATESVNAEDREAVSLLAKRAALNGHAWFSCRHPRELIALARHVGFKPNSRRLCQRAHAALRRGSDRRLPSHQR